MHFECMTAAATFNRVHQANALHFGNDERTLSLGNLWATEQVREQNFQPNACSCKRSKPNNVAAINYQTSAASGGYVCVTQTHSARSVTTITPPTISVDGSFGKAHRLWFREFRAGQMGKRCVAYRFARPACLFPCIVPAAFRVRMCILGKAQFPAPAVTAYKLVCILHKLLAPMAGETTKKQLKKNKKKHSQKI